MANKATGLVFTGVLWYEIHVHRYEQHAEEAYSRVEATSGSVKSAQRNAPGP